MKYQKCLLYFFFYCHIKNDPPKSSLNAIKVYYPMVLVVWPSAWSLPGCLCLKVCPRVAVVVVGWGCGLIWKLSRRRFHLLAHSGACGQDLVSHSFWVDWWLQFTAGCWPELPSAPCHKRLSTDQLTTWPWASIPTSREKAGEGSKTEHSVLLSPNTEVTS